MSTTNCLVITETMSLQCHLLGSAIKRTHTGKETNDVTHQRRRAWQPARTSCLKFTPILTKRHKLPFGGIPHANLCHKCPTATEKGKKWKLYAQILNNMGDVHEVQGELVDALKKYTEALQVWEVSPALLVPLVEML